jgi:rhodanese-related sulfurtransferase
MKLQLTEKSMIFHAASLQLAALLMLVLPIQGVAGDESGTLAASSVTPSASAGPATIEPVDRKLLLGFLADSSTMTLIDARSPAEFAEQHLPGAINIPFDAIKVNEEILPEDPARPVVIYCRTGERAGLLREQLLARGYEDVRVLPRQQMFWEDDFMVFNCSTDAAGETETVSEN